MAVQASPVFLQGCELILLRQPVLIANSNAHPV